ncbi:IS4 family transposase [Nocardia sp. IBHARD005]|uniref:IS4 family transposase n=1 Tax=Nocardia sp. IBHARD005 TaxID=3457765 RepID=UPI0040588976
MSVVAAGVFAPGHVGELTQIVPFDMVDAALETSRTGRTRVRELPARVVVYLLLAGALFSELGYTQVWARMVSGLDGLTVARPGSSALAQARRRVGPAPLAALFGILAGPTAGATRWRGLLVCAIDGTSMSVPNSDHNRGSYYRLHSGDLDSGYLMLRLVAVVACGTRTVIDAVFGSFGVSEIAYAPRLFGCLREGMVVLADRNFAVAALIGAIAETKADLLIRGKAGHTMPVIETLPDGSWLSVKGPVVVRVIDAQMVISAGGVARTARYRLLTTLTDYRRYPAMELVELYHQRWEIETAYAELKSSMLGARVLRARTPAGVEQEVYALLVAYQGIRIAVADATGTDPGVRPLQASFSIALNTARDQLIHAADVVAGTSIDLVGKIGAAVLAQLLPPRRSRQCPRVVKRALSKHRAKGVIDRTNYSSVAISINLCELPVLTSAPAT